MKYNPGRDIYNVCGLESGAARTNLCWKKAGTDGLPTPVAPRTAVPVAAPEEKVTEGGAEYLVPGVVTATPTIL